MEEENEQSARILQADEHHSDVTALLGSLIQQGEENNATPVLEALVAQGEDKIAKLNDVNSKLS